LVAGVTLVLMMETTITTTLGAGEFCVTVRICVRACEVYVCVEVCSQGLYVGACMR